MVAFRGWTTFINTLKRKLILLFNNPEHLMKLHIALIISLQTITDATSGTTTSVCSIYIFSVSSLYVLYKFSDLFEVLPI